MSALDAARERQAALRALLGDVYAHLTRRRYIEAIGKLEEALARAVAVERYYGPDECALDHLVSAAAVVLELARRLDLDVAHQAAGVVFAAVDLRARIHLGER